MEMVEQAPRLVISEMVLENFKSYAGAQRVGPFHKVLCPAMQFGLLLWLHALKRSLCFLMSYMLSSLLAIACIQSFSSVVGPNGSGKSNVIDAMLFVFGKRAKQVRHSIHMVVPAPAQGLPPGETAAATTVALCAATATGTHLELVCFCLAPDGKRGR